MGGEKKEWIMMATGRSPTNIAVIKYWGKRDESLILPINDSISVTLDPDHLSATTTVAVSPRFDRDRMWLNGKEISLSGSRFQSCLREIRRRAGDVEDEEKGIRIGKEDWGKLHLHIASYNNFPTAAGLASSAAGFACLVFSLAKLMNVKDECSELSAIARQGSGSACRSLFGGFVKWNMGNDVNGTDSIATQLADETHWDDLVIVIAVVSSRQKDTSSTAGMRDSVETSALIHHRAKVVVPQRIQQMEEAIHNRDFLSFAKLACADSNQFHAVCLDTVPPIFYMNDTSHRIITFIERWNRNEETPQVAYTFDAGPNAVLIAPNRKVASCLLQRLLYYFPPPSDMELSSYLLGDKSLLQEAGLQSKKDVEVLPPPPEAKDINLQKYAGDVSYFICTRPGKGPVLLTDEDQALLHPESGSIANGEMAKYLKTFVAPQLPNELRDPFISAVDRGNMRSMPNKSMPASPYPTPGALLMGDAFNMRHPLTGGGMTVALSDIAVLNNLLKPLRDLNDASSLCKYLESFYTLRKPVASTINTLAGALYKVFCASPDQAMKEMRQACFDYLSLGGVFSNGPVALLSGLNPRPLSLVVHFFAVAVYGVGRLLIPFPSPKRIWIGARLISGAAGIIFPIIRAEGIRQMFFPVTIPAYYRSPPAN